MRYHHVRRARIRVQMWYHHSVVVRNLYVLQPLTNFEIPDHRRVMWLKVLVIGYGVLSIALAFCAHFVGPLLQASMTILGIIGGPMLAVFTLGILVPYVNQKVTDPHPRYVHTECVPGASRQHFHTLFYSESGRHFFSNGNSSLYTTVHALWKYYVRRLRSHDILEII